jgi:RNA-directed DNA polymerase
VTQGNQGKHTPGVDKIVGKTPEGRGRLVEALMTCQPWRAKPARRGYIPKANGQLRPLGIPTVIDRGMPARVKNALEPAWEARFEGTSYGFRPGRGCHDAIGRIYTLATPNKRRQWIVDADIKGAFDHLAHDHLLRAIGPVPGRELICQWLKAGYVELGTYHDPEEGTPQGGVISPLWANLALPGLEETLGVQYDRRGYASAGCKRLVGRYADDFVVCCESREDAAVVLDLLKNWLAARGLALSQDKTRIVPLTQGFDFLGFNVRQYEDRRAKTGYRLLLTPSRESVAKRRKRLQAEWRVLEGPHVQPVLKRLNPIVRGWANSFRIGVANRTFKLLDHWMFRRMLQWLRHSHRGKSREWLNRRYLGKLHPQREDHFVFGDKAQGGYLLKFAWVKIERQVIVRGVASPDDPARPPGLLGGQAQGESQGSGAPMARCGRAAGLCVPGVWTTALQ